MPRRGRRTRFGSGRREGDRRPTCRAAAAGSCRRRRGARRCRARVARPASLRSDCAAGAATRCATLDTSRGDPTPPTPFQRLVVGKLQASAPPSRRHGSDHLRRLLPSRRGSRRRTEPACSPCSARSAGVTTATATLAGAVGGASSSRSDGRSFTSATQSGRVLARLGCRADRFRWRRRARARRRRGADAPGAGGRRDGGQEERVHAEPSRTRSGGRSG